jgi:hypothetical protein
MTDQTGADGQTGQEDPAQRLKDEVNQLSKRQVELLTESQVDVHVRVTLLRSEIAKLSQQLKYLVRRDETQRLPRDEYPWPWQKAADPRPDASTQKTFWVLLAAAAAAIALTLSSPDKATFDVRFGAVTVPLNRDDALAGAKIVLVFFTVVYMVLSVYEVVLWLRDGRNGFRSYCADHHKAWEARRGSVVGLTQDDYPKPLLADILLGLLKMVHLLAPLFVAGVAAVVLWA